MVTSASQFGRFGVIGYTEYDSATGAAVKQIQDADLSVTSQFTTAALALLPSGWSTPTGGGQNLATTAQVDAKGRTIQETDPSGEVTYTVYNDAAHETRTYRGWNSTTHQTTGPVEVFREDRAGNYSESLTFSWTDSNGLPVDSQGRPTGAESLTSQYATIQSLSRSLMNSAGQATESRNYFSMTGISYSTARNLGTAGVNYLETDSYYDKLGRLYGTHDPSGTAQQTFYDVLGRTTTEWVGTDDVPSQTYFTRSSGDPSPGPDPRDFHAWVMQNPTATTGPAGTSMYLVSASIYDNGLSGGDSNLTESRSQFAAGSSDYYASQYAYDWRDRQTGSLSSAGVASIAAYDNLGRTVETQTYASATMSGGQIVTTSGDLRAQSELLYDALGRVYESRTYEVDPSTGTVGDYLPSDNWYDPRGYLAKSETGSGPFAKYSYDGLGRLAASYTSFDATEFALADSLDKYNAALDVAGDTVVEQAQTWYYVAENAVLSAAFERLPDDTTTTGALDAANSYATASISWSDVIGRQTYSVEYGREDVNSGLTHYVFDGTTGELKLTDGIATEVYNGAGYRQPNSSDNYLVSKTTYNDVSAAGRIVDSIDNLGRTNETQYDLLGRTVRTIQNYDDGTVEETDTAADLTTEYQYDSHGRMVTLIAYNAKGDDSDPNNENVQEQQTEYLYTSAVNASWQTAAIYPDSADGQGVSSLTRSSSTATANTAAAHGFSTGDWVYIFGADQPQYNGRVQITVVDSDTFTYGVDSGAATPATGTIRVYDADGADRVTTVYDQLGRTTETTDQRAVEHDFTFDSAGRLSADTATSLGSSGIVDDSVRRIGTSYDDIGRVQYVTSYSDTSGTTAVNQVKYEYDSWGNLAKESQAHDGLVGSGTPSVQYTYADGATGGVAKYVRLTEVTYPNGREVQYGYGTTSAVDDIMSRLATIGDTNGTYAAYKYLGAGKIVTEDYADIDVKLDYAANNLAALDRFGRVVDQIWTDYGANPDVVLDEYKYGYDRAGNRLWKENVVAHDLQTPVNLDELYTYDRLDRLTNTQRGRLDFTDPDDPTITSETKYQDWTLDGLGNFSGFDDNGTSQTRTVNAANQIENISGGWKTPEYDAAGSMIFAPKSGDETTGLHFVRDAWNRQVAVYEDDGDGTFEPGTDDALVARYEYDGANRRIEKTLADSTATDYYYNQNWQMLEERTVSGSNTAVNQYVWSPRYIDAPVVRFHDGNGDGDLLDAGDNTHYYTGDANFNVTTTIDADGSVVERNVLDAYGKATVYDSAWANPAAPTTDGPLYCGYFFDAESGNSVARNRISVTSVGTWDRTDPISYRGGINLYEYVGDSPIDRADPRGLADSDKYQPLLDYYHRIMEQIIRVGDLINDGRWDALDTICRGCKKSFNDGITNPPPGKQGGMCDDPLNFWEAQLFVRPDSHGTTEYHFPFLWPELKAAIQYSMSTYGSMSDIGLGGYSWNVWGIGGIHLDATGFLDLRWVEGTLAELIHEPLHDFSYKGFDFGIFGLGHHSTIQMIVGPTGNDYFVAHNAFTLVCQFLQYTRCDDGTSLWDKVIGAAGEPPTIDGVTGRPPRFGRTQR